MVMSEPESAEAAPDGLVARLRAQARRNAQGRRLTILLPGWEDVGDGRALWARFQPLSRELQLRFVTSPEISGPEIDASATIMAEACEEILIGTSEIRTSLADEPDVAEMREQEGALRMPIRFSHELGQILGIGGENGPAVLKRMLLRPGDDLPFYGVMGELMRWSGTMNSEVVESVVGE
jgi:hypothetical protein